MFRLLDRADPELHRSQNSIGMVEVAVRACRRHAPFDRIVSREFFPGDPIRLNTLRALCALSEAGGSIVFL
jgi:hypothetical protein